MFQTTAVELLVKPVNIPDSRDQVVGTGTILPSRLKGLVSGKNPYMLIGRGKKKERKKSSKMNSNQ